MKGEARHSRELQIKLSLRLVIFGFVALLFATSSWAQPRLLIGWGQNPYGQLNFPSNITNVASVSGGTAYTLACDSTGNLLGWGDNSYGQLSFPFGVTNVTAVAAGSSFGLALRTDGTVIGWGDNAYGQISVPSGLSNVVAIAAGNYHSLALKSDGSVVAWGYNVNGQTAVPAGLNNVSAIAAGGSHSLALKSDGTVVAWGWNAYGQSSVPFGLTAVAAIVGGGFHSVAVRSNGTVIAWGAGSTSSSTSFPHYGQSLVPANLSGVTNVAAGMTFTLALKADGTVVGWGDDGGQVPPSGLTGVMTIAAGAHHALALTVSPLITTQPSNITINARTNASFSVAAIGTSTLQYQWRRNGANLSGETFSTLNLNNVTTNQAGTYSVIVSNAGGAVTSDPATLTVYGAPSIVAQPQSQAVFPGGRATLAVSMLGYTPMYFQWRKNGVKIVGATSATLSWQNVQPIDAGQYSVVVTNDFGAVTSAVATVSIAAAATVIGWGDSTYGQATVPPGLTNIIGIAAGYFHSVAIRSDGTVVSWGSNPTVPAGISNVVALSADYHTAALKSDGHVLTWESGTIYQAVNVTNAIGISAGYNVTAAVRADGTVVTWGKNQTNLITLAISNAVAVSAGNPYGLVLTADGTVYGWSTGTSTVGPVGVNNTQAIGSGYEHDIKLLRDGTVRADGSNSRGQLNVPAGLSAVAIAAGKFHNLALKSDGTVAAWGWNNNDDGNYTAQSVVPAGLSGVVAIAAGNSHSLALVAAPTISVQPTNVTVFAGSAATFSVVATNGNPLTYQWKFNGADLNGATDSSLTITNTQSSDAGSYAVTVSNFAASVSSAPAMLTVLNGSRFSAPQISGDHAVMAFSLDVGQSYHLQASTNLVSWTDLTNFTATSPTITYTNVPLTYYWSRFFRLVSP